MASSSLDGYKPDAIKRDNRIWFGCVSIIPLTLSLALLVASLRYGNSPTDLNSLSGYLIGGLLTVAVLVPTGYGLIVGNSAVRVQSGRILRAPPVGWFSVMFVPTLVITISACLLGLGYTDTTIDVPLLTAQMAASVLLALTLLVMMWAGGFLVLIVRQVSPSVSTGVLVLDALSHRRGEAQQRDSVTDLRNLAMSASDPGNLNRTEFDERLAGIATVLLEQLGSQQLATHAFDQFCHIGERTFDDDDLSDEWHDILGKLVDQACTSLEASKRMPITERLLDCLEIAVERGGPLIISRIEGQLLLLLKGRKEDESPHKANLQFSQLLFRKEQPRTEKFLSALNSNPRGLVSHLAKQIATAGGNECTNVLTLLFRTQSDYGNTETYGAFLGTIVSHADDELLRHLGGKKLENVRVSRNLLRLLGPIWQPAMTSDSSARAVVATQMYVETLRKHLDEFPNLGQRGSDADFFSEWAAVLERLLYLCPKLEGSEHQRVTMAIVECLRAAVETGNSGIRSKLEGKLEKMASETTQRLALLEQLFLRRTPESDRFLVALHPSHLVSHLAEQIAHAVESDIEKVVKFLTEQVRTYGDFEICGVLIGQVLLHANEGVLKNLKSSRNWLSQIDNKLVVTKALLDIINEIPNNQADDLVDLRSAVATQVYVASLLNHDIESDGELPEFTFTFGRNLSNVTESSSIREVVNRAIQRARETDHLLIEILVPIIINEQFVRDRGEAETACDFVSCSRKFRTQVQNALLLTKSSNRLRLLLDIHAALDRLSNDDAELPPVITRLPWLDLEAKLRVRNRGVKIHEAEVRRAKVDILRDEIWGVLSAVLDDHSSDLAVIKWFQEFLVDPKSEVFRIEDLNKPSTVLTNLLHKIPQLSSAPPSLRLFVDVHNCFISFVDAAGRPGSRPSLKSAIEKLYYDYQYQDFGRADTSLLDAVRQVPNLYHVSPEVRSRFDSAVFEFARESEHSEAFAELLGRHLANSLRAIDYYAENENSRHPRSFSLKKRLPKDLRWLTAHLYPEDRLADMDQSQKMVFAIAIGNSLSNSLHELPWGHVYKDFNKLLKKTKTFLAGVAHMGAETPNGKVQLDEITRLSKSLVYADGLCRMVEAKVRKVQTKGLRFQTKELNERYTLETIAKKPFGDAPLDRDSYRLVDHVHKQTTHKRDPKERELERLEIFSTIFKVASKRTTVDGITLLLGDYVVMSLQRISTTTAIHEKQDRYLELTQHITWLTERVGTIEPDGKADIADAIRRISKLMESDRASEVDDACRTADEKFRAALRGLSGAMS